MKPLLFVSLIALFASNRGATETQNDVDAMTHEKKSIRALVLAAGRSTRFKTDQSKLTFLLCGQEMILYPSKLLEELNIPATFILGYQKERVQAIIEKAGIQNASFVEQTVQKGTGHAVLVAREYWDSDHILIINGDAPLLTKQILQELIDKHVSSDASITFMTAYNDDPELTNLGRVVIRNGLVRVIELKEWTGDLRAPGTINAGIYIVKREFLEANIENITPYEKSGEIGIPELIRLASEQGKKVETVDVPLDYVRGVNTLKELELAEKIKRKQIIIDLMNSGVRFADIATTYIESGVSIEPNSVVGPYVVLHKGTKIGDHCTVGAFTILDGAVIHDHLTIGSHSVIKNSEIKEHIRPMSTVVGE